MDTGAGFRFEVRDRLAEIAGDKKQLRVLSDLFGVADARGVASAIKARRYCIVDLSGSFFISLRRPNISGYWPCNWVDVRDFRTPEELFSKAKSIESAAKRAQAHSDKQALHASVKALARWNAIPKARQKAAKEAMERGVK